MRFLCWFSHHSRYNAFRIEELEALASREGIQKEHLWSAESPRPSTDSNNVFVYCHFPDEHSAARTQCQSMLLKGIIEVWSQGESYEDIRNDILKNKMETFRMHVNEHNTWAFKFVSFKKSSGLNESKEKMNFFYCLFKGNEKVNLENANTTLLVAEEWSNCGSQSKLRQIYFGRLIAQRAKSHLWWHKYNLSTRPVLGPTTLDTELSFLMCHQAMVKNGTLVMDPFVGTGSILIAATHLGGYCIGSDIDVRVLKGWGISYLNKRAALSGTAGSDIFRNFHHYNLPLPDIVRTDISLSVWRGISACSASSDSNTDPDVATALTLPVLRPWVDAIITDPPYGIRAGARKAGHTKKHNIIKRGKDHVFPTCWYDARQTIEDLLNLASGLLVDGGRLVFLLLVETASGSSQLSEATHPNFEVLSVSPQILSGGRSRLLVTMRRRNREII